LILDPANQVEKDLIWTAGLRLRLTL
jgi:hypothetical protein